MDRRVPPARVLAVLYFAGASLGLLAITLPHPAGREMLLRELVVTAYLCSAAIFVVSERLPRWSLHAFVAVAAILIGAAIYSAGVAGGVYGSMFFWLPLFAGLFFSGRSTVIHVAWILAVYAVVLTQVSDPAGFSPITRWLLNGIALGVVGTVTSWIAADRDRIDRELQSLLATVDDLAHTDQLTGLPNRRAWEDTLTRELLRARRERETLCVAVIDVDHLKDVNDGRGHAAGDEVLRDAADRWRSVLRGSDYLARHGGDEFALMLPNCPLSEAERVVERLRRTAPSGQSYSAGIAVWDGVESAVELLHRADGGLYAAKATGRDRLEIAPA